MFMVVSITQLELWALVAFFAIQSAGHWLWGFSVQYGHGSALESELLALKVGLQIAWERQVRVLLCEIDSLEALFLLKLSTSLLFCHHKSIVMDIRELLYRPWEVRLFTC
ncbi:Reverse transcriptase-like [Sesbania bispinosa]|nr:Reverse transcriptase-like [Sesbania bispinosa]